MTTIARLAPCSRDHDKEVLHQFRPQPDAPAALSHAHQADLRLLAHEVAGQVGRWFGVDIGNQHRLRKTPETVFNPGLIQQVTLHPIKVLVEIKPGVTVPGARNGAKNVQVAFTSHPDRVRFGARLVTLGDVSFKCHPHVGQPEIVRLG